MLVAEHLSKLYGNVQALSGVDYQLAPGDLRVIMGPSGSGKSTLHRVLALLEEPSSGTVRITELDDGSVRSPWPLVTVVFQRFFLWPHLTLRENILLPLEAILSEAQREVRLEEAVQLFDMSEYILRYPNEVSAGQQQRAALARALVVRPRYLLLDEITSALDAQQAAIINEELTVLSQRGIGVSVITHSLHFAKHFADWVSIMDNGRIIEDGGREIFNAPESVFLKQVVDYHEFL